MLDSDLHPNCLITRYPILFGSHKPQLVGEVTHLLHEHGYEVYGFSRLDTRIEGLIRNRRGAHFILEEGNDWNLPLSRPFFATRTVFSNLIEVPKLFFLKLAIHLAEKDLLRGD